MGYQLLLNLFVAVFLGGGLGEMVEVEMAGKTEPIEISFTGDVMMDWSVKSAINQHGPLYPFEYIKEEGDYAVTNLETAVTTRSEPYEKTYNFKSNPPVLQGLKDAGFDMVSLANNHTMDYKEAGLLDTIEALNDYKLTYIGAGKNESEAYSHKVITLKGKDIAFLGFSRVLPSIDWYATEHKPGIASGYQLDRIVKHVKRAKEDADYVIVYIHWGTEKSVNPELYQKTYARKMIDVGADAIIGSHPHVLQGFEFYKEKPIAYSLGNFLFPDYVSGKTAQTGILSLHLNNEEITMEFTPYQISNNRVVTITDGQKKKILDELQKISYGVDIIGTTINPENQFVKHSH
jgi:poly-gamma-glutamate capsule biosynthesis protein CapA/YwtB (metallophosphatase superfamily)